MVSGSGNSENVVRVFEYANKIDAKRIAFIGYNGGKEHYERGDVMTFESIKVDIIIPVYNKEKYIRKCIDSILNQTHKNFNLILVDDGSTDNSGEICKKCQEMDERVRFVYQPNGGQTSARRHGLEYAETEFVLFMDADDWIDDNYLEILIKNLYEHDFKCDLITSGMIIEENDDSVIYLDGVEEGIYIGKQIDSVRERFVFDEISQRTSIIHSMSGKIFKKDKINRILQDMTETLTFCEDGITVFAYLLKADYVVVLNYTGYHYVQYEDSTIHSFAENDVWRLMLLKDEYVRLATKAGIYEKIKCSIAKHIYRNYLEAVGRSIGLKYGTCFIIPKFLYQNEAKVVIYGAGVKGKQFKRQISKVENVKCVGWVDIKYEKIPPQYGVDSIERLLEWEYDYVLIAIENREIVHSVVENLMCMGISYKKIWAMETQLNFYLDI